MKEDIVSFELAKLAKEKNFNVTCNKYYQISLTSRKNKEDGYSGPFGWKKGELSIQNDPFTNNTDYDYSNKHWYYCAASTLALLQKWIREIHKIHIDICYLDNICGFYYKTTIIDINIESEANSGFKTYEQAFEAALFEVLKLI